MRSARDKFGDGENRPSFSSLFSLYYSQSPIVVVVVAVSHTGCTFSKPSSNSELRSLLLFVVPSVWREFIMAKA
ncbi:hypothetical protein L3X38_015856 [Prunus dulcis]|uniref:Uncharacterized protein n=1 Tax=Prunus dulcis TaxID=3755 RepID=A0AAD4W4A9_PRUDU|nr:hypothetical protein L3X38_015856 [Prunus dulcis]